MNSLIFLNTLQFFKDFFAFFKIPKTKFHQRKQKINKFIWILKSQYIDLRQKIVGYRIIHWTIFLPVCS